jgi:Domain of unknown function (DUF4157)
MPAVADASLAGGRPLPPSTRQRMERSFGQSFDGVRIHDDADASALTELHGAEALTVGKDIAFRAGRFRPESEQGDRILAHELAHVVQQQGAGDAGPQAKGEVSQPHEPAEQEAEAAATRVARGERAGVKPGGHAWSTRARLMRLAESGAMAAAVPVATEALPPVEAPPQRKRPGEPAKPAGEGITPGGAGAGGWAGAARESTPPAKLAGEGAKPAKAAPKGAQPADRGKPSFEKPRPAPGTAAPDVGPEESAVLAKSEPHQLDASVPGAAKAQSPIAVGGALGKTTSKEGNEGLPKMPEGAKKPHEKAQKDAKVKRPGEGDKDVKDKKLGADAKGPKGPLTEKGVLGEKGAKGGKSKAEDAAKAGKASGQGSKKGSEKGGGGAAGGGVPGLGQDAAFQASKLAVDRLVETQSGVAGIASTPVHFAPTVEETSTDPAQVKAGSAKRRATEDVASNFLAANAGRLDTILAVGETVEPRIDAVADAAKAQNEAAVLQNQALLEARIGGAMAAVESDAVAAEATIEGEHAGVVAGIEAATQVAQGVVAGSYATADAAITPLESAQLSAIDRLYGQGDTQFRAAGVKVGDEAVATAQTFSTNWLSQLDGEFDVLKGALHDNRLEAKSDAALNVGKEYKKGLVEAANRQADEAQKGKPKDLEAVGTAATQSRTILTTQKKAADDALDSSLTAAVSSADQAKDGLVDGVHQSSAGATEALSTQLTTQIIALDAYGQRQNEAIDRDAQLAISALMDGVSTAADSILDPLRAFVQSALGASAPGPQQLGALLGKMNVQLDTLIAGVLAQLSAALDSSETSLIAAGAGTLASIDALGQSGVDQAAATSDGFSGNLGQLLGQAATVLTTLLGSHAQSTAASSAAATKGFEAVTGGTEKLFQTIGDALEKGFTQSAKGLEEALRKELDKLPDAIKTSAEKAEAEVQPLWKTVLKVVLVIVVIIVVALVIGPAVIGAVGAAAGALGAGATGILSAGTIGTVLGGALVGAAAGATIQLGNNIIDGKKDLLEGVWKAAVVGFIGGALGGLGSVLGKAALGLQAAGGLSSIGQTVLKGGIEMAFNVGGGVLGDLAVGNPVTLKGVLMGAAIGLGVQAAGANLAKLGSIGEALHGVQTASEEFGAGIGSKVGGGIAGLAGIEPKVPIPEGGGINIGPEGEMSKPEIEAPKPEPEAPKPEAEAPGATAEPAAPEPGVPGQPATESELTKSTATGGEQPRAAEGEQPRPAAEGQGEQPRPVAADGEVAAERRSAPSRTEPTGAALGELDEQAQHRMTGAGTTQEVDPTAARLYDEIRASTSDVPKVAEEMGIGEEVAARVKEHLFVEEHDIPTQSGMSHESFEPVREYAEAWKAAENGTLTPDQRALLQDLLTHENVEATLHGAGTPVYDPDLKFDAEGYPQHTFEDPGAHSKAVIAERGFTTRLVDAMTPEQRATMLRPMMEAALEARGYAPYTVDELAAMHPEARTLYDQITAERTQKDE